jgi:hypothetical protein
MDFLFGAEVPLAVRFFFAFIVVLCLIGGTAYLIRRFGSDRLGTASARGRQPRLAVIDAAAVDGRRRLILIRRDNVEHLIMIGGPTDVVVEANIVRAAAAPRDVQPARPPTAASDAASRPVPLGEGNMWPLQPEPVPPVPRPRSPVAEETAPWHSESESPPPRTVRVEPRTADPLAGLAAELARQPPAESPLARPRLPRQRENPRMREPQPEGAREPQGERTRAAPVVPAATDEQSASTADQNLADMAQRLEAALRRPKTTEARAATAARSHGEPESASAEAAASPGEEAPVPVPAPAVPAPAAESKPAAQKSVYDSLEQEMASLLGRPGSKT